MFKLPAINKEVILQEKSDKKQYNSKILKFAHICLVIIEQDKFGFSYLLTEKKFIFIFFFFFFSLFYYFHFFSSKSFSFTFLYYSHQRKTERKNKPWLWPSSFAKLGLKIFVECFDQGFDAWHCWLNLFFLHFAHVTAGGSCIGLVKVGPAKLAKDLFRFQKGR